MPLKVIIERSEVKTDAADTDNVVTRAEQGHLHLLDWEPVNPLLETSRMPRARRRAPRWPLDWYGTGIALLMASAAAVAVELLSHLAG